MSYNKLIIIGNLGRDGELKYASGGDAVLTFSVATTEKRKGRSGEMEEHTLWFRCTLWGKRAESLAQYLLKGKPVYVEGRLRIESYTDREGQQRQSNEVNVTEIQLLGGKFDADPQSKSDAAFKAQAPAGKRETAEPEGDDSSIPF